MYHGTPIRPSTDFSTETLQARREWHDIFKVLKRKKCTTKNALLTRLLFRIGENFPDKQTLKELSPQSNLTRNVKGSSLSSEEKATTKSKIIIKKSLTGKDKHVERQWINPLQSQQEIIKISQKVVKLSLYTMSC